MKQPRRLIPRRPDGKAIRGVYESVMRALARVVTDRRWAAPLSAMALGFGLFLGVAIGPGAAGGFATGGGQIIAVAESGEETGTGGEEAGGELEATTSSPETEASGGESEAFEPALSEPEFEPEPLATEPVSEEDEEAPESESPPAEEEETEAETQELKGTVVHANPAAGSYTMAIAGGELVSIHAPKLPVAGTKLTVEGSPLANNTFGEEGRQRSGGAAKTSFGGVVTYVDPDPADPAYTVSGRGSSILVHVAPAPAPQLPVFGAYVTVSVQIEKAVAEEPVPAVTPEAASEPEATCSPDPALPATPTPTMTVVQKALQAEPEPATYLDLAGIVSAVCPATGQLLISADDLRESEADTLLAVPTSIKTAGLEIGDSVLATATVEEDGTLTLAGLASDERSKGAEDAASAQGDLKR